MTSSCTEDNEPSLYFHLTQMQARHEEREQEDRKLQKLQQFKHKLQTVAKLKPAKDVVRARRPPTKKGPPKITSISAFVKETLSGKKAPDHQNILDFFGGDSQKMGDFLARVESATAQPHLLSAKLRGLLATLISGPEWRALSERLQVHFPNLSKKHKRSLRQISKRLDRLKALETPEAGLAVWSQASRQPSDDFTSEDIQVLYDTQDKLLHTDETMEEDVAEGHGACLTLSQAFEEPAQRNRVQESHLVEIDSLEPFANSESVTLLSVKKEPELLQAVDSLRDSVVGDSEPELEGLSPTTPPMSPEPVIPNKDTQEYLISLSLGSQTHTESGTAAKLSPIKSDQAGFETPVKWPAELQISSSPLSPERTAYSMPRHHKEDDLVKNYGIHPMATSPLSSKRGSLRAASSRKLDPTHSEKLLCRGPLQLSSSEIRLIQHSLTDDLVPDSEDDTTPLMVEICRPAGSKPAMARAKSVLQVPSSPERMKEAK